jgi:hypothetical protein
MTLEPIVVERADDNSITLILGLSCVTVYEASWRNPLFEYTLSNQCTGHTERDYSKVE